MLAIIVLGTFIAIALAVFALLAMYDDRGAQSRVLRERLEAIQSASDRAPSEELEILRDELLSDIPALHNVLSRSHVASSLQLYLSQADMKTRAGKFLLLMLALGAAAACVTILLSWPLGFAVLAGIAGVSAPLIYASWKRSKRFHKFEENFPQAIDFLARAIRAGHAFSTALEMIGNEVPDPVGGEFRKVFEEQKFGLPIRDALLNLTERVPLIDVKFFVTAVMLQRESGGNLAEIFDKLSYVIRERFKILRQVRIHTAQGRLTMIILMLLPPGLVCMLYFMNPDFIKPLFYDSIGHALLFIGIVLQTIGYFLIRRIINIEV